MGWWRSSRFTRIASGILVVSLGVWWWLGRTPRPLPDGISPEDYERTSFRLKGLDSEDPDHDEVLFQLGLEHADQQQWQTADHLFAAISSSHSRFRQAIYLRGQVVLQQDRLRLAEQLFRDYLSTHHAGSRPWKSSVTREDRIQALHYLSYLLAIELRFDERRQLLAEMIAQQQADLFDTLACHFQSLMVWNHSQSFERIARACQESPQDLALQAALARYQIAQGEVDQAWELLNRTAQRELTNPIVASACLTCLEERNAWADYLALGDRLPPVSESEPVELLRHRGQIAVHQGQLAEAERYYLRALNSDPAHLPSRLGLSEIFLKQMRTDRRSTELDVIKRLVRIQNRLGWAASKLPPPEILLEIARLSDEAGLSAAARDVCLVAIRQVGASEPFTQLLQQIESNRPAGGLHP